MPLRYPDDDPSCVRFEGSCAPEEAETLLEWLRRTPAPAADLSACSDLHMALAQLLLAARVRLCAPPPDAVLAACLGAMPVNQVTP
jgi:hypothetical protein